MAYALRFFGKYQSADGTAQQIWLEQEGFGGSESQVQVQADPVVIEQGRRGIDIFSPIRASRCVISLYRTTAAQLDALFGGSSLDWQVRIVSGTTQEDIDNGTFDVVWQGFLVLDNYEDSTVDLPDEIQLEAIDGLSLLHNIPYTDTSGTEAAYTGREAVRLIANRCLKKTTLGLSYYTSSRLFADSVAKTVDPWDNIEIDNAVFYSDEDGAALSCYDVLKICCYRMLSILFQRDGIWHFVALDVVTGSAYDVYTYDTSDAAGSTGTGGVSYDIDSLLSAGTIYRETGKRGFLQPMGSASVHFNHGVVPPLIRGGSFNSAQTRRGFRGSVDFGDDYTDYWTLYGDAEVVDSNGTPYRTSQGQRGDVGSGRSWLYYTEDSELFIPAFFHGTSVNSETVKTTVVSNNRAGANGTGYAEAVGSQIETGQKIVFRATIRLPYNAGDGEGRYMAYWKIEIDGEDYVLGSDGSWIDSSLLIEGQKAQYVANPGSGDWGSTGLVLDREYTIEIFSDAAPATGDIVCTLYGTSDVNGSDLEMTGAHWDEVSVTLVDEDGDALETTVTEIYTGDPDDARDAIVLPVGPGPVNTMDSRVEWNGTYYTDFETDRLTTAADMDEILVETWLRFLNRFLERRVEQYKDLVYEMGRPLEIASKLFFPTWTKHSLRHDRLLTEIVELVWDGAASLTTADYPRVDGLTIGFGGGVDGGGSTLQSSPGFSLPFTTKGDLLVADGDAEGVRLAVGTDGQVLRSDSTASNGVTWATITEAAGIASGFVFLSSSQTSVTVTPAVGSSLFFATILCCLHTEAASEEYAPVIENITATTFEVRAQGTPGEQLRVQWLVIAGTEAAALSGSLDIDPGSVSVAVET